MLSVTPVRTDFLLNSPWHKKMLLTFCVSFLSNVTLVPHFAEAHYHFSLDFIFQ